MTTNSQLSTTEPKKNKKQKNPRKKTKQLEQEQKWRSHGGLSTGRERKENGGKGMTSINSRYKIDGEVKNSVENGEAKELICMTHGRELRGDCWWTGGYYEEGGKGEKIGTTVIA